MEGSVAEDLGAPESWEVADLDDTMRRLMLKDSKKDSRLQEFPPPQELIDASVSARSGSSLAGSLAGGGKFSDDIVDQVDQFLREALQNPRERLSILRMEQDVEKFIRDPLQQQLEFQQLPTSYLRLAAHRVAQHYSLQSMVLLDNSLADGSGSRIIVRKTSECKLPLIRLADIPVSLPSADSGVVKVAIKQRPQKHPQNVTNLSSKSLKTNSSKSVEERKEEYNRARARIFNSTSSSGGVIEKPDGELRLPDGSQHGALGISRIEEKLAPGISDINPNRASIEASTSSNRSATTRTEKDPIGRGKSNNRVAIFRDREVDRKDPDYDRSYDRYLQRFDPGFGFNTSPYAMQPMYTPALNYNTEFPQLGSSHSPQMSTEHQSHALPQHLPGPWAAPSTPTAIGYSHPDTVIPTFNPNHVGTHSTSTMYMHSSQYPSQRPGIPFIHPHEHVQPFSQPGPVEGLGLCLHPAIRKLGIDGLMERLYILSRPAGVQAQRTEVGLDIVVGKYVKNIFYNETFHQSQFLLELLSHVMKGEEASGPRRSVMRVTELWIVTDDDEELKLERFVRAGMHLLNLNEACFPVAMRANCAKMEWLMELGVDIFHVWRELVWLCSAL